MRYLLFLMMLSWPPLVYSQESAWECELYYCTDPIATPSEDWLLYLNKALALNDDCLDSIPSGRHEVLVQLLITKAGTIEDVKVLKDPGYGLSSLVRKAIKQFRGSWSPAKRSGRPESSYRTQPIIFLISDPEVEQKCKPLPAGSAL
ncbi:MAG: energy transducer TonB [Chitinophagaceae bacterium]|nr:energy transducer TonB [Chitinophagaceae bacterium]